MIAQWLAGTAWAERVAAGLPLAAMQDWGDAWMPLLHASSMEEAVQQATQKAHAGDAVLMSPACASWDMFKNYAHRAEVFCQAVAAIAEDKGTSLEVQP